ncbi:YqcI/YcgG family protein [Sphaerimonospora cavernae]|uniref:YqcI/YcgG family protein n=1 Tax=Sphaerimonospora cavernae TaxID=1740611 RepID=A0ABV6U674_9ACTN
MTRPATGLRSLARLLGVLVEQAEASVGADRTAILRHAEDTLAQLGRIVGRAAHFPSPRASAARHSFVRLHADAARVRYLADAYTGIKRPTAWERFRLRGVSIAQLSGRMSARIRMMQGTDGLKEPAGIPFKPLAEATDQPDDWAPISGEEAEAFHQVMERTQCVFARRSTIWTAPSAAGLRMEDAVHLWSRALRGFVEASRREKLDGLVLPLPAASGDTVDRLALTTRRVLEGLAEQDAAGTCDLRSPERAGWYLSFYGERMFVVTVAPCYPTDHSRHGFGEPHTFVLLQPDRAFDRAVSPGSDGVISTAVRSRIRELYKQHGRPYDLAITLSPFEAHRFVKPLALGDPPIRWWRDETAQDEPRKTK